MRSPRPDSRTRSRASSAWRSEIVTPTPRAPYSPRRVDQQRPPAAADVEHAIERPELELAADQVELARLRGVERVVPRGVVRARVDHRRPEHRAVHLVRDVVVMADRFAVAAARVKAPAQAGLDLRRRRRPVAQQSQPARGGERHAHVGALEADVAVALGRVHRELEVAVDVEVARDPGAAQPELARGAEDPAHRVRAAQDQPRRGTGGGRRRRRQLAAVPEAKAEGAPIGCARVEAADERRQHGGDAVWRGGRGREGRRCASQSP